MQYDGLIFMYLYLSNIQHSKQIYKFKWNYWYEVKCRVWRAMYYKNRVNEPAYVFSVYKFLLYRCFIFMYMLWKLRKIFNMMTKLIYSKRFFLQNIKYLVYLWLEKCYEIWEYQFTWNIKKLLFFIIVSKENPIC